MKRKYLKNIEVYIFNAVDDGAGGNVVGETKLTDSWCNVITLKRDKLVAFGLDVSTQAIRITTRFRNDLDYFQDGLVFKYKGKNWVINSITDVDEEGIELDIIATAV